MTEFLRHGRGAPARALLTIAIGCCLSTFASAQSTDSAATSAATAATASAAAARSPGNGAIWAASWATSPASYFVYAAPIPQNQSLGFSPTRYAVANIQPDLVFPFPNANSAAGASAVNQTFRSIIKPDLWGTRMRVRFTNTFGDQPLVLNAVTVGLQEYAANIVPDTLVNMTFNGVNTVTVMPGQEVWSDAIDAPWADADQPLVQGRNLAVSYSVQGDSGHMTHHSGANQTSYITGANTGDHTRDLDGFAYEYTTTSWFFIDGLDVRAPADTTVVAVFGDSITDGTHTTLNGNDRWANVLSRRLHNAYGNKVSVVNEAIGGNRVIPPTPANATSGPAAVDRLDRDVLGLSGLSHVIWLEGINDLGAGYGQAAVATPVIEMPIVHTPANIIAGYENVISRLHNRGVKVYGATVVSALGFNNPAEGWDLNTFPSFLASADNGPLVNAQRLVLNNFIRGSGQFDGVADFDTATLDPATGNMKAPYVPNSQFTQLPWDYLHPNHAGYNAMGLSVDIRPFAPRRH